MTKLFFLLLLTTIIFSCSHSGKKPPTPEAGQTRILGVFTRPDSSKQIDVLWRIITKNIKYDSAHGKDVIEIDTFWAYPRYLHDTARDEKGKPKFDSLTKKPIIDSNPTYFRIPRDSINTHIENIPIDSLLKKN